MIFVFQYFYSIKDITIGGMCICHGHAHDCPSNPLDGVSCNEKSGVLFQLSLFLYAFRNLYVNANITVWVITVNGAFLCLINIDGDLEMKDFNAKVMRIYGNCCIYFDNYHNSLYSFIQSAIVMVTRRLVITMRMWNGVRKASTDVG